VANCSASWCILPISRFLSTIYQQWINSLFCSTSFGNILSPRISRNQAKAATRPSSPAQLCHKSTVIKTDSNLHSNPIYAHILLHTLLRNCDFCACSGTLPQTRRRSGVCSQLQAKAAATLLQDKVANATEVRRL